MYQLVWGLRQLISKNKEGFPKPGAALLHDALTHAVIFFIEVYQREWDRSSGEATPVERAQLEGAKRRRKNIIENTERISA